MADDNAAPAWEAEVLQKLAERYYEIYKRSRSTESPPSIEAALMRMMAVMGEVSSLAFLSSSGISPFEKDEVSILIGKLSISVAMIAEAFQLNVARSTLRYLEEELRATATAPREHPKTSNGTAAPSPLDAAAHPKNPPETKSFAPPAADSLQRHPVASHGEPVVLSPTTNGSFFRYVDQLAALPRESFEKADLKWVAPLPDGTLEELVPNGRMVKVCYEDLPQYLSRIALYREARTGHQQQHPASPPLQQNPPSLRREYRDPTEGRTAARSGSAPPMPSDVPTVIAQAPGYDPVRESMLYSPSHFTGGLFSPLSRVSDVKMTNIVPPPAVAGMEADSNARGRDRRSQLAVQNIGKPYDASSFFEKLNMLRRGEVPAESVAQLGLTFCVPDGKRVVELINDGMQVGVNSTNVAEFLRLVERYPTAQTPSARVHRTNSVRKIEVGCIIPDVPPTFSPSHFSMDLFAPFKEPTPSVYVDYDNADRMLPQYLKEHHVERKETRGLYVSAVQARDFATLHRILSEVKVNPTALTKYGVTYSVPSALEPYSTPEECRSGLHSLFPGSASRPVLPEEHSQFLSLARHYFPNVL